MIIQCKFCEFYNDKENTVCSNCSKSLLDKDEYSKNLFNRLNQLERNYLQEFKAIRKEISDFSKIPDSVEPSNATPEIINETTKEEVIIQDKALFKVIQPKPEPINIKIKEPSRPSQFSIRVKELLSPIHDGIELLSGVFTKYKREGKLPIFFMTIAGILAILFGFGYLMQITLNYLGEYQEMAKIGAGFTSAIILVIIGIRLSKKGETLKEYGSALISLGIILNYLMIYFMSDLGNFPVLASSIVGFSLISLNTLVSIHFSLKYEAKVISVISLIGGALAPLYLNAMEDGRLYFLFLWFLAFGSCYVSKKIEWKTLSYITFVVSLFSLEVMVFNESPNNFVYTLYYHLFAYLFFYLALFDGIKLKKTLVREDIVMLAGNLAFFLYNLFNASESNLIVLGLIYILNGLAFSSILLINWKNLNKEVKLVLFIVIGALIGFAIPSIFDQKLMGLFWSIEAMLLIILGFHFSISTIRKEGYILLCIALVKLMLSSISISDHWNDTIWHQGLLNYITLGAVFTSLWFIGRRYQKQHDGYELSLYSYAQEIVPLWLATIYLIIGFHLVGEWIINLSIIPLFGFIYWKKYFNTKYSDLIGLSHLLIIMGGVFISIQITNSLHFSDQLTYAQIAILEFVAILWLLVLFYKAFKLEDERTFKFTQQLRTIFYCLLPLIFIYLVNKYASEFIELGFWIGTLLAYFLSRNLKLKALRNEFYILSVISFGISYIEMDPLGFISGIVFILSIVLAEKAMNYETLQASIYKKYLSTLPFVITVLIGSFVFSIDEDYLALSLSTSSFVLVILAYFYDKIGPIKKNIVLALNTSLFLNLISIISLTMYESFASMMISIANLFIFSMILINKKNWFKVLFGQHWNRVMILLQFEFLITYSIILMFLGIDIMGPLPSILLATHAIIAMFVAMKNQIKVLNKISIALFALTFLKVIFHDINGFNTNQKVIVLIILGLILLSASYGYVKLSKYFGEKLKTVDNDKNTDNIK